MRRIIKMITAAALLLTLTACEKKEDLNGFGYRKVGLTNEIRITDIAGDHPHISELALMARVHVPAEALSTIPAAGDSRIMLRAPFNKKETRLVLPVNPPQELLSSITNDIPKGFTISDTGANTIAFVEIACNLDSDGNFIEFLYFNRSDGNTNHDLTYIYCDRPVTITGTAEDWWTAQTTYDLSLKKGWNCVVEKETWNNDTRTKTVTNLMPSGMQWQHGMWL